jgi:MFS family permease
MEGPIVGHLIDKYGPRVVMLVGMIMAGAGFIGISFVGDYWSFFLIYIFVISLGYNAGFLHPVSTTVNAWFIRYRGFGFSCFNASMGIGGMVLAPLLSSIIMAYGWRAGMVAAGVTVLVLCLPAALPIRRSPEEMGLHPDGMSPVPGQPASPGARSPRVTEYDFPVREALKTSAYWRLMVTISLRLFATSALAAHLIPILVWKGFTETTGAYLVSLYGFSTVVATMVIGWVGDRWSRPRLSSLGILPLVMVLPGLLLTDHPALSILFPIALSVALGTAPLNWVLIGDFFGRKSYATLRGIMGISYGTATFLSPVYAGWVFDRTGSYGSALIAFSIVLAIASLSFALLRLPSRSPNSLP